MRESSCIRLLFPRIVRDNPIQKENVDHKKMVMIVGIAKHTVF